MDTVWCQSFFSLVTQEIGAKNNFPREVHSYWDIFLLKHVVLLKFIRLQ